MTTGLELQQLKDQLEKMQFHIQLIGETIDYEKYPIPGLVINFNWSPDELDSAYDIFEEFEKKIKHGETSLLHFEMENEFKDRLGISYQGLKCIVSSFYKNSQFVDVCIAYAKSFGDLVPIEIKYIVEENS